MSLNKAPLSDWLLSTLKKGRSICEDADRKNLAQHLFINTIDRVAQLAVRGAVRTPRPTIERHQGEDHVTLSLEWSDAESGWFLRVSVRRVLGEKPHVLLEMSGNPDDYSCRNPTDEDITKSLHDYFEKWKREKVS